MGAAAAPGETVKDVLFFATQRAQPRVWQGLQRHVHCKAAAGGGSSRCPTAVSRCTVCGTPQDGPLLIRIEWYSL